MAKHHRTDSAQYLLRLAPDERAALQQRADAAGVPLSEALRRGADLYLNQLEKAGLESDLAKEVYALASKIDSRLRGS